MPAVEANSTKHKQARLGGRIRPYRRSIGNADPFKAQNGLSGTEFESIVLFR